ncbi:hypothetical protein ROZALSC1DRAFT_31079, partial [Rozella allomycis CSF55]
MISTASLESLKKEKTRAAPKSAFLVQKDKFYDRIKVVEEQIKTKVNEQKKINKDLEEREKSSVVREEIKKLMLEKKNKMKEIEELEQEYELVEKDIEEMKQRADSRNNEINKAKEKFPYKNTEEIDRRINRELEVMIESQSFSLKQEKSLLQDISKLTKAKKDFEQFKNTTVNEHKPKINLLKEKLNDVLTRLRQARKERSQIIEKLKPLQSVRDENNVFYERREKNNKEIERLKKEKQDIYQELQEFKKKNENKIKLEKEKREMLNKVKQVERKIEETQKSVKRLEQLSTGENEQIIKCKNLIQFFQSNYLKTSNSTSIISNSSSSLNIRVVEKNENDVAFKRKDDADFYSSMKKEKVSKKSSSNVSSTPAKFTLPMWVIAGLSEVVVAVPTSV